MFRKILLFPLYVVPDVGRAVLGWEFNTVSISVLESSKWVARFALPIFTWWSWVPTAPDALLCVHDRLRRCVGASLHK